MVKILHISDAHGERDLIDKLKNLMGTIDIITVGGDFEDVGILDLLSRFGKPVYAVLGNMDPLGIRVRVSKYLVEGRIIDIGKDLYLAGYPIEIGTAEGLGRKLIVLSHYPPYDCKVDMAWGGRHIGSKAVREFIERAKPLVMLTGHVHESPGVDDIVGTVVVNPGPFYEGRYAIVHISEYGAIKVELGRL
jgi:Icc-related predicted phosphoesterase